MSLWTLTFVGTGGFHSAHSKGFPCVLLDTGSTKVMFDCGDGSLAAMRSLSTSGAVDVALLSGATAEEMLGLVSVADWVGVSRKSLPLSVVGPRGTADAMDSLLKLKRGRRSPIRVHEALGGEVVLQTSKVTITAFELLRDDDPGLGFVVEEANLPGRVDMAAAQRLGLSGPDIGRLVRGETVDGIDPIEVVGPERPGRKVVLSGRTRPSEGLQDALGGADVAVLAAAYIDERWEVAASTGTMTGWEAASASSSAEVRLLALYNVSSSNPDRILRLEARQYHPNVFVPGDGDRIEITQRDAAKAPTYVRHDRPGTGQAGNPSRSMAGAGGTNAAPRRNQAGRAPDRNRPSDRRRS